MIFGDKRITSKEGISSIYKVLAGISTLKDITDEKSEVPLGGTSIEIVMKNGTQKTINVSHNIYFGQHIYEPNLNIADSIATLVRKYMPGISREFK